MFASCFKQEAVGLPNLQNGGWKPRPCFVPPLLSHSSATWPPAKGAAGPSQHPRTSNSFLSVSQLTFLTSWVGWLANPRDLHVTASPALGLQLHITMPGFCSGSQMQISMLTRQTPYPQSHLPSTRHDFLFLNLALATTETNYMIF